MPIYNRVHGHDHNPQQGCGVSGTYMWLADSLVEVPCKAVAVFKLALEKFAEHASWCLQSTPMRYGACPSHHAPSSTDKHSNPIGSAGSSLINQSVRQRYAMCACFSPRLKCLPVA